MQTFKALEYLKIDIANSFGLDKKDWDERIKWFDENEHQLMNLMQDAENVAQYYAGLVALRDVKAGKPTGYLISLDATSSGIQILSVLTGDRKAAQVCNVLDTGHRRDAYTDLYRMMQAKVVEICGATGSKFARADLKQAIMTSYYGSQAVPKKVFGDGNLLMAFYKTLEEETPHAWALNKAFLKMWDPEAPIYEWVMPDNFHVKIKVMDKVQETVVFMGEAFTTERSENQPTPSGRSIGANVTHSIDGFIVRELERRCDYDPRVKTRVQQAIIDGPGEKVDDDMVKTLWETYQRSGYLSARVLDYLDTSNIHMVDTDAIQDMLDSMPEKPFKVIPVHDCFKVHPNYGNDLRKQYNLQLSLIAKSNMLSFVLSQFLGYDVPVVKKYHFADEVLNANYALS